MRGQTSEVSSSYHSLPSEASLSLAPALAPPASAVAAVAPELPAAVRAALGLFGEKALSAAGVSAARLEDHYSSEAIFDDPLVYVRGLADIRTQFETVQALCGRIELVGISLVAAEADDAAAVPAAATASAASDEPQKSSARPRRYIFEVTVLYRWSLSSPVFGIPQRTTLHLDEDGMVVHHHDEWLFVPDSAGLRLPALVRWPYLSWRRAIGWGTSRVARWLFYLQPLTWAKRAAAPTALTEEAARQRPESAVES
eukprot:TRINITY_DN42353_c0_g1_i1.p1 TRINITY_DN42353_c0_g1~~TRINITY_DN42353_c0_g1_i1.p1  ORF type:complete len:280 (+),score=58.40 TRINITY_DN42353_c0_g1_i1:74-841(+)